MFQNSDQAHCGLIYLFVYIIVNTVKIANTPDGDKQKWLGVQEEFQSAFLQNSSVKTKETDILYNLHLILELVWSNLKYSTKYI